MILLVLRRRCCRRRRLGHRPRIVREQVFYLRTFQIPLCLFDRLVLSFLIVFGTIDDIVESPFRKDTSATQCWYVDRARHVPFLNHGTGSASNRKKSVKTQQDEHCVSRLLLERGDWTKKVFCVYLKQWLH